MRKGFWKRFAIKLAPHTLLPRMGNFARTFSMVENTHHVKLVHSTARQMHYREEGNYFVKEL